MSKIIDCLKLLQEPKSQATLSAALAITQFEVLELIGKINQIEPNLINATSSSSIKLTRNLDWLNPQEIREGLAQLGHTEYTVKILGETLSTNTHIANNLVSLANKAAVIAEYQSKGRGRQDRQWQSKVATDLTVSVLYLFPPQFKFELLPLISAIAVNRLLKQFHLLTKIKWPNDVYTLDGTKIVGILVESGIRNEQRFVIVGIGLDNIIAVKRSELVCHLLNHLDQVIREYSLFGFTLLRQEWLDNCIHYNRKVEIYQNHKLIDSGINSDLTDTGQLIVKSANGVKQYISSNISLKWY
ncbi:MAG: biotin--[acetyl-CoA-carboxylase] ligase [Burkholderiales bacterium]